MSREEFIKHLNDYHDSLCDRLDKGQLYVKDNPTDYKAIRVYNSLTSERSEVERLINYYKCIINN